MGAIPILIFYFLLLAETKSHEMPEIKRERKWPASAYTIPPARFKR